MGTRRVVIEFLGQDKSASKTTNDIEKKTSKLGSTMASVGKTAAVGLAGGIVVGTVALAKMTKGAAEDQAAQDRLAKTLKNAAKATDGQVAAIEDYISKTGVALGVTDDKMRPAFENLVRATGDVGKAQGLMTLALDASAGTGKDLEAVTMALSKAQNGSTGALGKLGIATKDASGKALSFEQIQKNMAKTFQGQAATAANTLEGKMGRLRLIFAETQETIGAKLLPIATRLGDWFLKVGVPAIGRFGAWLSENVMPKLRAFGDWIQKNALPLLRNLITQGLDAARGAFDRVRKAVQDNEPQLRKFASAVGSVWSWVSQKLGPVLGWLAGQQMAWVGRQIQFVIVAISKFVSAIEWTVQKVRGGGQSIAAAWSGVKASTQGALQYVTDRFLSFVDHMLRGAAKAFGWVPGIGDKLRNAAKDFARFRDDVNARLAGIRDQQLNFTIKYTSSGVNVSTPSSVGRRAIGGPIHGPGTGTSDDVPIMASDGEHMMTAEEVRKAGGHGAVFRLRRAIREGSLGHFAAGGPVGFGVRTAFPSTGKIRSDASDFAVAVGRKIAQQFTGNVASGPPGGVQRFRGELLNQRTIRMLTAAERVLGATFRIMQGSYSTRVAASAGTHSGGGVLDTNGPGGWGRAVSAMRRTGFAAWHRTPAQGPWGHHIHAVAVGDSSASSSAKRQVRDYLRGGDGLGSYRQGTPFVPQTGLYQLHRGERVTPAEDNQRLSLGGGMLTVNLVLDGKVIQQSLVRLKKLNGGLELGLA